MEYNTRSVHPTRNPLPPSQNNFRAPSSASASSSVSGASNNTSSTSSHNGSRNSGTSSPARNTPANSTVSDNLFIYQEQIRNLQDQIQRQSKEMERLNTELAKEVEINRITSSPRIQTRSTRQTLSHEVMF